MSVDDKIEKFRELLKRMERALGEENVVTLNTLNDLGIALRKNISKRRRLKLTRGA